jgi:hypothetical protein
VLRFRADGVTHVLFIAQGLSFLFMTAAEGQAYHPHYGLSSYDEPALLLQGQVPSAQLTGSIGVGWRPTLDVDPRHDPGGNPNVTRCRAMLAVASLKPTSRGQEESSYGFCDPLFLLQAALRDASSVGRTTVVPAIESLGSRYRSALSLASRLGPGRHDGAAAVRRFAYDDTCSCFHYVGAVAAA